MEGLTIRHDPSGFFIMWRGEAQGLLDRLMIPFLSKTANSAFTATKIHAAAQIFTISCENSKILSRLLSVLSLHRKFVAVAVQIQLPYSQTPKCRPSSTLGEDAKICL
jgi:hypothetical protein